MHITVTKEGSAADGRTSAYVQYRVFDTVRSREREIRHVGVALYERAVAADGGVSCTVTIDYFAGNAVVATATADWPYAAIERALAKAWNESAQTRVPRSRDPAHSAAPN